MKATKLYADLFAAESPRLKRFLRRFGPNISADDIAQESFAKMCAISPAQIDHPRAYLFRTAHNLALNELHRIKCSQLSNTVSIYENEPSAEAANPEERAVQSDELRRLAKAVSTLPERQRLSLIWFKIDGLSYKEIGRRLGVSHRSVERYVANAVARCYEVVRAEV